MTTDDRTKLDLTAAGGCSCCAAPAVENFAAPSTTTQNVLVAGMTCAHCVTSVREEIVAIDGVDRVSVELNAAGPSRVTIHSNEPIDAGRVRAAVQAAGYTLADSPA